MAVFVLGAGTTRGASFVNPAKSLCLPPLDADFFTQLQRVENPKHRALIDAVIEDTVGLFGTNFHATLETTFTTLEHTIRMVTTTGDSRDFKKADLQGRRDRLLQAFAAVVEEALTKKTDAGGGTRSLHACLYHRRLVDDVLSPGDDIISLNYDCLIDHALRRHGNGKWNARYGYGFSLGARGTKLVGEERWQPGLPADKQATLHLYKLHGSLHFIIQENGIVRLKERPYTKQHGGMRFTIIPPESHKAYDEEPFKGLWQEAGAAIHRARDLVVIGYSLPLTDLHSTALFRTSVRQGSLRSLVIVNPDREARKRIRDVVQRGLTGKTRVLVFDTLREFSVCPRRLWDQP